MFKLRWLIIITLLVALLGTATPAFAADTPTIKENPQSAQEIFSSVALLNYYSSSLDYIIQLDQTGSDFNLAKMPFANVPQELTTATGDFASNGLKLTASLVNLFALWNQQNTYIQQYRLNDAGALYTQITNQIPAAQQEFSQIKASVADTGVYLNIGSLPSDSGLKPVYDEVMTKIQQLSGMLDLLSRPLISELAGLLKPTELTLSIDPQTAYVGDEVSFKGTLSSKGAPLPERQITLLLNNADLLTVQTDAQGQFQGSFHIPFLYIDQMPVQAVYYPQDNDAGVYLAATSPVLTMTVLFYAAQLTLQMNNPVYPGKEAMLSGTFNYADRLVLLQRKVELYLDNNLEEHFDVGPSFNKGILLNDLITPGKHIVTVSAPATGRFASVTTSYVMDVTLAATFLVLKMPAIGFIPGSFQLSGKLYSSAGPLANAIVLISEGKTTKQVITDTDGTFSKKVGMGLGFSLLGTQGITLQVQPQEPWNAPLTSTKNIFLINYVNLVLILIVLVILAVYLPRRFEKWFAAPTVKKTRLPGLVPPVPLPVSQSKTQISLRPKESPEKPEETASSVFYWYRVALKLVQQITKTLLAPHQTLREYGRVANPALGPAGKYFMELTYLIEKRLYGKRQPDNRGDVQKSQELVLEIQKEAGREP